MSWPVPERRAKLLELYCSGKTFRDIAKEYGGTPDGVRSTIRKMIERGDVEARQPHWLRQPRGPRGWVRA